MSSIRALASRTLILAAAASLGACAVSGGGTAAMARLPTGNFPVRTSTAPTGVQLAPHETGLSAAQIQAVRALAAEWSVSGEGGILIESPAGASAQGASVTVYDARDALIANGTPANAIQLATYAGDPAGPIRISFQKVSAVAYDCAAIWDDLTKSAQNTPTNTFGCAVSSNIAVMLDNPADALRPRPTDPANAERRQFVLDQYRAGESTSSANDADASISGAIQ
jgi:pilus assembly protein CpaD